MSVIQLQPHLAIRSAAQTVHDLSDIVKAVSARASVRQPDHMLFVLDRDEHTAVELLTVYAPPRLQLARGGSENVDVVALSRADGLTLLRAPQHMPTVFRVLADQIEANPANVVHGVCVAGGGFVRFDLRELTEGWLN